MSLCPVSAFAEGGVVSGKVTVLEHGLFKDKPRGDNADIAVVLEGAATQSLKRAPQPNQVMRQREQRFVPGMLVVEKGGTVDFPNDDKVDHNVFSPSDAARFDLELYRSGTSKSWTFRRTGAVNVFCNIHENMAARIVVTDSPLHAITGKDGRFEIQGVPPGSYSVLAWPRFGEPWRGTLVVKPGKNTIDVSVVEGRRPDHQRKDGTPYGRYQ